MKTILSRLKEKVLRRSALEEAVLLGFCLWALYVVTHYRTTGYYVLMLLPWAGIVFAAIGFLSLAVQLLAYVPTKEALGHDLRLLQRVGRLVLFAFVFYGAALYVNCAFDLSPVTRHRTQVVELTDGEIDWGRFVSYAHADLRSWENPGAIERVFVTGWEQQNLWAQEPVIVEVHEGLLGMKWISAIRKDNEAHLMQVIKIAPTAASAWKQLIWTYLDEQRWEDAVKTAHEYFRHYPDDADTFSRISDVLFMYRQFGLAIQVLEPVLAHRPHYKVYQMAAWNLGQGWKPEDKKRALQLAKAMVAMEPENPVSYYTLGYIYYWLGDSREALLAFDRLLVLWPGVAEIEQIVEGLRKPSRPAKAPPL